MYIDVTTFSFEKGNGMSMTSNAQRWTRCGISFLRICNKWISISIFKTTSQISLIFFRKRYALKPYANMFLLNDIFEQFFCSLIESLVKIVYCALSEKKTLWHNKKRWTVFETKLKELWLGEMLFCKQNVWFIF